MATRYTLSILFLFLAPCALAQTWTPQASGTAADLGGVHFLDETTGFAVGDEGLLLTTTDGGETWTVQIIGGGELDLEGVAFNPSGTIGLIATDDGPVYRSTDEGATWTVASTGVADLRHVSWADDRNVWVAGREASAARSPDAGETWTALTTGSPTRTESVAAVSATEAWVVNRSGGIRHTADGGATWTPQAIGTGEDLNDIQMLDANTGFIAGDDGVFKTTDGGQTWTNMSSGDMEGGGLFFLDADTGWVVGAAGQIWFTADGGASWTLQSSGTSAELGRAHFPDPNHGWAVGAGGAIVAFTQPTTEAETETAAPPLSLTVPSPNPFSERTTFTLTAQMPQRVQVEVFDPLGRRVDVLHDESLAAGTALSLTFDAAAWPSGLYVVRATGDGFSVTRRFTLIR